MDDVDAPTIMASRLKAECSAILQQVDENEYGADLIGSVRLLAEDDDAYFSTGETFGFPVVTKDDRLDGFGDRNKDVDVI